MLSSPHRGQWGTKASTSYQTFFLLLFPFESQISTCTLSARNQCLHATEKLHRAVFSPHWAGIFMSSIIHITACCSDSRKTSEESCSPVRKSKGIPFLWFHHILIQEAKQCLLPMRKPCDLEQHCPGKDSITRRSEPDPDKSFEIWLQHQTKNDIILSQCRVRDKLFLSYTARQEFTQRDSYRHISIKTGYSNKMNFSALFWGNGGPDATCQSVLTTTGFTDAEMWSRLPSLTSHHYLFLTLSPQLGHITRDLKKKCQLSGCVCVLDTLEISQGIQALICTAQAHLKKK